jgi:hypothetical protein
MPLNLDEQPTVARVIPIQTAPKTAAFPAAPPIVAQASSPGSSIVKVVLVVIGLSFLLVLGIGVAGILFYYYSAPPPPVSNTATPRPTEEPRKSKDDDEDLRKQIANLEKQLNEQKKKGQNSNVSIKVPNSTSTTTATVNSPGDGFLALRSLPNSEIGERILKIPHGSRVTIGACGPVVTPVKRSGRWCQASYGGYDGWVFDAYLNYE